MAEPCHSTEEPVVLAREERCGESFSLNDKNKTTKWTSVSTFSKKIDNKLNSFCFYKFFKRNQNMVGILYKAERVTFSILLPEIFNCECCIKFYLHFLGLKIEIKKFAFSANLSHYFREGFRGLFSFCSIWFAFPFLFQNFFCPLGAKCFTELCGD